MPGGDSPFVTMAVVGFWAVVVYVLPHLIGWWW